MDTLSSGVLQRSGCRSTLAVSGFRLRARLGFSIPLPFSGQRGITPAFGYSAPHPGAGGTSTLLNNALLSAHYEPIRPCAPHWYSDPPGVFPLGLSLDIGAPGSHVPHKSQCQARAAKLPVTVQPVNRFLLDLIPGCQIGLVLMTVGCLSTEHLRFTLVRLPGTHLTSSSRLFPVRSPPGSLSPSSAGRFEG